MGTETTNSSHLMETEDDRIDKREISELHQRLEDDDPSKSNGLYLSVVWQGGKIGFSYYDIDTTQIFMMPDHLETDNFTLLKRVIVQLQPYHIIVSTKLDDRLLQALKIFGDLTEDTEQEDLVQIMPSIDYNLDICKRRILNLDLPTIPKHFNETERTIYLSSLVKFDNVCMVRSIGGLIKYLQKMRIGIELEDDVTPIPILSLKYFTLEDQIVLDDTAYSSLQIFQKESHPSVYKAGQSSAKEGLSLFGIMNRCRSPVGSRLLRLWFQQPLRNLKVLTQRQDAVAFFLNHKNVEVLSTMIDCIKNIKNITKVLTRMNQAQATVNDWSALYKTTYNAIRIADACKRLSQNIHIFQQITEKFTDDLQKITTLIKKIVDFEESTLKGRFVVRGGVDPTLDEKKRTYNGLPDFMTQVAREELNSLGDDVTECNVIYLPQLGYLLAIPRLDHMKEDKDYEIPGLELKFMANNILHYKSKRTLELDTLLGDTLCEITDQETVIMHKLQSMILEHSNVLIDVMDLCAQLDCLITLAVCAGEFRYVRPKLEHQGGIHITAGRHPLQELCCSPFVPNDTNSDPDHGKIKILTGPNSSGKSVYLKQVGIIVYLAHIGSFVPAEEATLGLCDQLFTRIRSLESVSVGLSTFMLDINQMADGLRNATENSLVLVDEFGKGTETIDGLSLLTSCILFWNDQGPKSPHVIFSTHFHSLIQERLLPSSPHIKFMTMETMHEGAELHFLYQLIEGQTSSSYASHVALQAGVPAEVVKRGEEVSRLIRINQPILSVDTPATHVHLKRCEKIVERFLELDLDNDDLESFLHSYVLPVSEGHLM